MQGERIESTREKELKVQGRNNWKYKGERIESTREKELKEVQGRNNWKNNG